MRTLYHEFFHIPKHEKIREKVMLARAATSVATILLCLIAMSIVAFAYFSHDVTSGSNMIKTAHFQAKIVINDGEIVLEKEGKYQVAALEKDKPYTVTIFAPTEPGSAKTGFCVITDQDHKKTYHTQQLGVDAAVSGGETPSITFTLTVGQDLKVYFLSHWGTSSSYDPYHANQDNEELYILDRDEVTITLIHFENNSDGSEPSQTPSFEEIGSAGEIIYTVQSGDTLSGIALMYHTSVEKIAAYNKIENPSKIITGQKITIPPENWTIPEETPPVTEETPPVTEETPPVTEETPPVTEETPPVTEETPPATEETPPALEETPPVTEETPPVTEETPPLAEETPPATEELP